MTLKVTAHTLKPVWVTLLGAIAFARYGVGAFLLVWLTIVEFRRS